MNHPTPIAVNRPLPLSRVLITVAGAEAADTTDTTVGEIKMGMKRATTLAAAAIAVVLAASACGPADDKAADTAQPAGAASAQASSPRRRRTEAPAPRPPGSSRSPTTRR